MLDYRAPIIPDSPISETLHLWTDFNAHNFAVRAVHVVEQVWKTSARSATGHPVPGPREEVGVTVWPAREAIG